MPFLHPEPFLIPAAAKSFLGPQLSWVPLFLRSFLFRHATVKWRDVLLPATVTLLLDSQYPPVPSFGFWRRSAARFWILRRLLLLYWNKL
jgi:hypothetical protein